MATSASCQSTENVTHTIATSMNSADVIEIRPSSAMYWIDFASSMTRYVESADPTRSWYISERRWLCWKSLLRKRMISFSPVYVWKTLWISSCSWVSIATAASMDAQRISSDSFERSTASG